MSAYGRLRARAAPALACLIAALACCAAPPPAGVRRPGQRAETLLQVGSTPGGARIILDGKPTGFRTPTSFPVAPGEHRITISLAGHRNVEQSVRVEAGGTQRVEGALAPLASGALSLASLPSGAQVFVDGDPAGQRTPVVLRGLAVGTHTVELRRPGSQDWCQAVTIADGRTLEIQTLLSPSRRSLGTLAVRSQPARAAMTLEGYPTGRRTPAEIAELPAGHHRVELTLEGYRPWSGTALVREGRTVNLLVTLQPLPVQEVGGARIETDPPGPR
jgi:hypothetical protein